VNKKGNPLFRAGNTIARGNAGGGRRKTDLARMLEQFAPRVVEVIEERLNSADAPERWRVVKELLPYLWPKKQSVAVAREGEETPSLTDYLAAQEHTAAAVQPALPAAKETAHDHH